jgi:ketosteroid isomerase-like protein
MRASQRLIVEAAYTAWASEDLAMLGDCLHEQTVSLIHMPPGTWPMSGPLLGKPAVLGALAAVARNFQVVEYRPLKMTGGDGIWTCRARIHYGHRTTGLSYEATTRNVWKVLGDRIISYEVFHDAGRLRAFYKMVSRAEAEA